MARHIVISGNGKTIAVYCKNGWYTDHGTKKEDFCANWSKGDRAEFEYWAEHEWGTFNHDKYVYHCPDGLCEYTYEDEDH